LNDQYFKKTLINTYLKFLKRKPDDEGFSYYMNQLKNAVISVNDLEEIFRNSDEFKIIKNRDEFQLINNPELDEKINQSKKIIKYFSFEESIKFFFFQFLFGNSQYFYQQNKNMNIRICETPHFDVAKQHVLHNDDKQIQKAKKKYIQYLKYSGLSYGYDTGEEHLNSKYQKCLELFDEISSSGKIDVPVILTQIPGLEGYYVVDGNHRCSIASALGLRVPANILDFQLIFDQFMQVDEFYGTGNKHLPYQSIYIKGNNVRNGRRTDIYERLDCLPKKILKQKTILDIGSNFGMNSITSFKFGAKRVLGLEISKKMVNFATRFAIFNGCYLDVQFKEFNLDKDHLPDDEKYDVAFIFSVHHHLKNPSSLSDIVKKNIVESVIFEGHPGTTLNDYQNFLDDIQFSKIEKIAELDMSVFDKEPKRPLWIFYK
jgi:hypothetical protein